MVVVVVVGFLTCDILVRVAEKRGLRGNSATKSYAASLVLPAIH